MTTHGQPCVGQNHQSIFWKGCFDDFNWSLQTDSPRRADRQLNSVLYKILNEYYSSLLVHVVSVALVKIFTPARVVLDNIFTPALLCGECFENIHPCSWGECCVAVKTIDH